MTLEHDQKVSPSPQPGQSLARQIQAATESNHAPLSTVAAAAGGGIAGAAVGRLVGGQVGTTIGAVVGGVAGAAIEQTLSQHSTQTVHQHVIDAHSAGKEIALDRDIAAEVDAPDPTEAPTLAHRASKLRRARTHYQLGVLLGRQQQFAAAIEEFATVLRLAPESAETHYNLGVAFAKQGNIHQGIAYLRQSRDLCLLQGKDEGAKLIEQTLWALGTQPV